MLRPSLGSRACSLSHHHCSALEDILPFTHPQSLNPHIVPSTMAITGSVHCLQKEITITTCSNKTCDKKQSIYQILCELNVTGSNKEFLAEHSCIYMVYQIQIIEECPGSLWLFCVPHRSMTPLANKIINSLYSDSKCLKLFPYLYCNAIIVIQ